MNLLNCKFYERMNWIKNYFNKDLVKVYSHPRSGTHFLEAFLSENFYSEVDLNVPQVKWGHWANRKVKLEGNPFGQLFGSHYFPNDNVRGPILYIYRDVRAVAYSCWNTENFLHSDLTNISFSDFLLTKIDWHGSPGSKCEPKYTIAEHWEIHVEAWLNFASKNDNILVVRYENLVDNPHKEYLRIKNRFFPNKKDISKKNLVVIDKPTGLKPNKAKKDAWREVFTEDDKAIFVQYLEKFNYEK